MSKDKTLGRARGLNSIADPSDFKGSRGRRGRPGAGPAPENNPDAPVTAPEPEQQGPAARTTETPPGPEATPTGHGNEPAITPVHAASAVQTQAAPATPHRAVVPGMQRKRRELSVPVPVADAVAATGINAADVVMTAYRDHSDAVFGGSGGRMVARGRQRLRLSISDAEFDKLTRLGEARGWNRSETVTVLLTLALLDDGSD